jgi:hypothetical protein
MTDETLTPSEEIALWKRATGFDHPEDLDSFLGRNGIRRNFDILNELLNEANKEKARLQALVESLTRKCAE